jgi:peptide/nickel transport system substrate-binding protein
MFQGFRWQLIAFIIAIVLFGSGLMYRSSTPTPQQPTSTPTQPTQTPIPTEAPTSIPTDLPLPTPFPETSIEQPEQTNTTTYREGIVGDIQRLNPIFAHLNTVDTDITSLIFEGLMKTNAFGEPVLNLASDLLVSNDRLEYVFTLRDDVLWQDGLPFTADDVVYTMSLLSSSAYESYSPTARFWRTVETQKLANNLVRFRLTQPLGSFTSFLTVGILPEHALTGTTVDQLATHPFNLSPIGTGAYQLASLRSRTGERIDEINLQFSPNFARRPEAQTGYLYRDLSFRLFTTANDAIQAYTSGTLDALANVAPRSELIFLPDSRIYTQVEPDLTTLIYNWEADDRRIFADRRVRQALSFSINQQEIIERHITNDVTFADSPLIPGSWAYTPNANWYIFDMAQATQLMDTANITPPEPISDTEVEQAITTDALYTFSILFQDTATLTNIATDIRNQWQQLGFDVSVESVSEDVLYERLATGDFQAAVVTLPIGSDPDVYRYWHAGQAGNAQNYGRVNNNEVAELLEIARGDNNGLNRTMVYEQFQERFAEQAIAIPLYYPLYTLVTRNHIEGVKLGFLGTSADRFRNIQDWRPASLAG